jgi:hypothetical protein
LLFAIEAWDLPDSVKFIKIFCDKIADIRTGEK